MDRRTFVKTAVGLGIAGAAGATATALTMPLAKPRPPAAPPVAYFGLHKIGGPAPRGTPLIPIFVNAKGDFEGRTVVENVPANSFLAPKLGPEETWDGKVDILEWYKYCGHQGAAGLSQDFAEGDSVLRYFIAEDKLKLGLSPWFKDRLGEPIRPEHFTEPGLGASFVWRSEGQTGAGVLTGVILRWNAEGKGTPADAYSFKPAKVFPPGKAIKGEADLELLRTQFLHADEFAASSTFCPHFCCIPGYKEAEKLASSRDAADKVFCTCHFSIYNPREVVGYTFSPEGEVSEKATGGGGH